MAQALLPEPLCYRAMVQVILVIVQLPLTVIVCLLHLFDPRHLLS